MLTRHEQHLFKRILREIWKCDVDEHRVFNPMVLFHLQRNIASLMRKVEKRYMKVTRRCPNNLRSELRRQLNLDLSFVRTLGDTMAWHLIKPYTFRQHAKHPFPSPPQTRRRGFKAEMLALKQISRYFHEFVIGHSLTNSLRIGDISIIKSLDEAQIIEVKSFSRRPSELALARMRKQLKRLEGLEKLHKENLLEAEELSATFSGFSPKMTLVRATPPPDWKPRPAKNHFASELNAELLEVSKDEKVRFVSYDNVIGYVLSSATQRAVRKAFAEGREKRSELFRSFQEDMHGPYTLVDLYERPFDTTDIPPLATLFEPDIAFKLLTGELIIQTVISASKIADYLLTRNVKVDTETFLTTHKFSVDERKISGYLLYPLKRVMYAVHSAEYLANTCLDSVEIDRHMKSELLKKHPDAKIIEFSSDQEIRDSLENTD